MSTFSDFRSNPYAAVIVRYIFDLDMSPLRTWEQFTDAALLGREDLTPFLGRVFLVVDAASHDEMAVLIAVLCAAQCEWLAEDLLVKCAYSPLELFYCTSDEAAQAVAACMERRDESSAEEYELSEPQYKWYRKSGA